METKDVKVRVGQKWKAVKENPHSPATIVKIVKDEAYYTFQGQECLFGHVTVNGYPRTGWLTGWVLDEEAPTIVGVSNTELSVLSFFKAVPDGYCPCNIIKSQCEYHKG